MAINCFKAASDDACLMFRGELFHNTETSVVVVGMGQLVEALKNRKQN